MERDSPDILFFPPALSVAVPLLAVALEWAIPLRLLPAAFSAALPTSSGLLLMVAAGALAICGARAFKRAGTNVDPRTPALVLVETGPYRITRNPMYLGMVVLQAGLALTFSLDWALLGAPILWAALHWGVVLREEAYLIDRFGAPYEAYIARTRRWI